MFGGIASPIHWWVFLGMIGTLLALDLGVFHRKAHTIGFKEALAWSAFWLSLSLGFGAWVGFRFGRQAGLEFLTGYLIEEALSVDNIFVFLVIFRYFAVPRQYQHRVLFWGIVGAITLRATFIALGTVLIQRFHWILYLFGFFLVVTGAKIAVQKDIEVHPERNPIARLFRRLFPMTSDYRGTRFFVREGGKLHSTPLLLVVGVVEATDVVFAVDSIPAVFGVTSDPYLVFTSNIMAVMGLRALYFVLAGMVHRFAYLKYGLGMVLVFIGGKMLASDLVHVPITLSLAIVAALLLGSVLLSWLLPAPRGAALPEAAPDPVAGPHDDSPPGAEGPR